LAAKDKALGSAREWNKLMNYKSWSKRRRLFAFLMLIGVAIVAQSCATQPKPQAFDPPGFFSGLLHGFLILFSFIASLFTNVRIYSFPNSGGWYDFGYLIGASMFLGGGGASASS
jgi:hypothetical protein